VAELRRPAFLQTMTLIALLTRSSRSRPWLAPAPNDADQILCGDDSPVPKRPALWAAYKRLTELGFPRRFPIVQFPNPPLIIAFASGKASQFVHGAQHPYVAAVSYLAMTIWAYEELAHGVNWFRHLLGVAYVVILVVRVAHGLHA
jgi:hypothetical protein